MATDISKVKAKSTEEKPKKKTGKTGKAVKFAEIAKELGDEITEPEEIIPHPGGIVFVDVARIHPHPDNPRKDMGDLAELTESIKKNGLMQNVTLIPMEDEDGEYLCLIGHRRCAAAKEAGVSAVPAVIKTGLSANEQLGIMLEENMQREDLSIVEQAKGFQMMLDLGETVETITKKTGFSETTVRHRIKLNELDADLLEENQYQFTLADLYELEKVDDPKEKNRILNQAGNADTLKNMVRVYLRDKEKKENTDAVCAYLEEHGVHEYDEDECAKDWYKGDPVFQMSICESKEKLMEQLEDQTLRAGLFYKKPEYSWDTTIYIKDFNEGEETPEEDADTTEKTEKEIFAQKNKERRDTLAAKIKEMNQWRSNFLKERLIPDGGKNPFEKRMTAEGQLNLINEVLKACLEINTMLDANDLIDFTIGIMEDRGWIAEDEDDEMKDQNARDQLEVIPASIKMIAMLFLTETQYSVTFYSEYRDEYNPEKAGVYMKIYRLIEELGLKISDEEKEIIGGTHELYKEIVPEEG